MMSWGAAIGDTLLWRPSAKMQRLAQALARDSENFVRQRVGRQVVDMSRPEARGYIRARAALPVGRAVDKAFMRDPTLPARSKVRLQAMVTENVVRLVMRDLTQVPAIMSLVRRAG